MKKIISILLAISVLVLCFSGCSSKETNEETKLDVKFTYDSIYSDFDDSTKRAYEELCNAVVNYQDEIRVNVAMLDDILQLFYTSCPFYALTQNVDYNEDKSGIAITYKYSEEEHKQMISNFNDKIVEIEKECGFGAVNNSVYILNVYNYITSNMAISNDVAITLFDTVINGEGSSFSYSNLFEYLLLQKDILAFHIIAEDSAGTGWGLSSAQLDGEIYYFDMATEFYSNGGSGINYFAMNSKDLKNEGLINAKYTSNKDTFVSNANRFDACRIAKTWSLEGNTLTIQQADGNEKSIELK